MKVIPTVSAFALLLLAASCATPLAQKQVIRVRPDDSMVNLCAAWAEAYARENPHVFVEVSGNGPGRPTLKALDQADIVATMRRLALTNAPSR